MADMKKLLHTFDEADELLNGKIERTNLSTIIASATASVENKKTVLIRGTGRNIENLKIGGRTVQDGTPTPDAPVEVKGVGDKVENLLPDFSKTAPDAAVNVSNTNYKDGEISFTANTASTGFQQVYWFITRASNWGNRIYFSCNEFTGISDSRIFISQYNDSTPISGVDKFISPSDNKVCTIDLDSSCTKIAMVIRASQSNVSSAVGKTISAKGLTLSTRDDGEFIPSSWGVKYKIPVSCNGETTNIYLDAPLFDGEVADLVSGKAEKKYEMIVLTGDEDWKPWFMPSDSKTERFFIALSTPISDVSKVMCNYFKTTTTDYLNEEYLRISGSKEPLFLINKTTASTVDEFKNWVKSLYNSGKPLILYAYINNIVESFAGAVIPTTAAEQELAIDTEVTPATVDVTSFGDYYTKAEIDKKIDNMEKVVEYENVIDVVSTTATKIPFATMFPDVNKENVISLVVMTGPYNNDNITRYLDTLMALRITSTVNQKVAVRVRCVYK